MGSYDRFSIQSSLDNEIEPDGIVRKGPQPGIIWENMYQQHSKK
jgi:hypothetical protein